MTIPQPQDVIVCLVDPGLVWIPRCRPAEQLVFAHVGVVSQPLDLTQVDPVRVLLVIPALKPRLSFEAEGREDQKGNASKRSRRVLPRCRQTQEEDTKGSKWPTSLG